MLRSPLSLFFSAADLFMVCKTAQPDQLSYQIWLNDKSGTFRYSQGGLLPQGAGPITFADMGKVGAFLIGGKESNPLCL